MCDITTAFTYIPDCSSSFTKFCYTLAVYNKRGVLMFPVNKV